MLDTVGLDILLEADELIGVFRPADHGFDERQRLEVKRIEIEMLGVFHFQLFGMDRSDGTDWFKSRRVRKFSRDVLG